MAIFGLEISNTLQGLINEISSIYKEAIQFKDIETIEAKEKVGPKPKGAARVENGIPTVYISIENGLSEKNIAHELLHLRFQYQGFPRTNFPQGSLEALVAGELLSIMEHRLFYPELENMGYDPHGSFAINVKNKFVPEFEKDSPYPQWGRLMQECMFSIWYLRINLESNDSDLIGRIDSFYIKKALKSCFKILGVPQEAILQI